ncbi:Hypothetical predicted protein [Mytilus galloprovincialis]|uniref:Uncharacterized protein n=1 Tax=Mytilus galloprovincialis TaxID=29158 RepID=A0A8B6FSI1_MYTGA|nr:Hypothetical predicted protein [Mytilus galloprovincialis]
MDFWDYEGVDESEITDLEHEDIMRKLLNGQKYELINLFTNDRELWKKLMKSMVQAYEYYFDWDAKKQQYLDLARLMIKVTSDTKGDNNVLLVLDWFTIYVIVYIAYIPMSR